MSKTILDPDDLATLIDQRQDWTYPELAAVLSEQSGREITPGTVRRTAYDLRQAGRITWGTDDARLRPDSLVRELITAAGRGLGEYKQHTIIQYLRQLDRRRQGRSHSIPGSTLDAFEAELLDGGEVIDLRPSGEPYRRPARPDEAGRIIARGPSGEGA